jgi:tetratricopeptide (TPR) repeat protein|tara:strand:+ start:37347 stop:38198 length:852 start_codon:yes stop_codon:yes gene_type:complete
MKKKSFLLLLSLIIVTSSFAQLKSPNASPRSNISQIIGLVSINLDYSRPSKKSREIFGGLVPYNKIWRTGANNPTTISFSDYVKINDQLISAGEYHLYSVPTESTLDLVIYEKTDAWGSLPTFDKSKVIARVSSDFIDLPNTVETFTISFENISNNGSTLNIMWDNKLAVYNIDALTKDKMINNINNVMNNNPSSNDYSRAAMYYFEEDIDIEKAMEWINKAYKDSDNLRYWHLRYKALIYEKAGKLNKALEYAESGYKRAIESKAVDGINSLEIIYRRLSEK